MTEINYAFETTIAELNFDIRFVPSRPWNNMLPGVALAQLPDLFVRASLVPQFEPTELISEDQSSFVPMPWTFLLHRSEGFEIGVNSNRIIGTTRKNVVVDGGEYLDAFMSVVGTNIGLTAPAGIARLGIRSSHNVLIPYDDTLSVQLKDVFEIQPRTGPRLPAAHAGFDMELRFMHEEQNLQITLNLESRGLLVEQKSLLARISIDAFTLEAERVKIEDRPGIEEWFSTGFTALHDFYYGSLKPKLPGTSEPSWIAAASEEVQS